MITAIEKVQGVFECYDYYYKVLAPNYMLTSDQFDDCFCSLLNDC